MSYTINKIIREMENQFTTSSGGGRTVSQYPDVSVVDLDIVPEVGMKAITFRGEMKGSSSNYNTKIKFVRIKFYDEKADAGKNAVAVKTKGGEVYIKPLSASSDEVQLYCSCPDMRHTFAHQLDNEGSWIGKPSSYQRKPGSNRPPRNPTKAAGMCKHAWNLIKYLESKGYITS